RALAAPLHLEDLAGLDMILYQAPSRFRTLVGPALERAGGYPAIPVEFASPEAGGPGGRGGVGGGRGPAGGGAGGGGPRRAGAAGARGGGRAGDNRPPRLGAGRGGAGAARGGQLRPPDSRALRPPVLPPAEARRRPEPWDRGCGRAWTRRGLPG